MPRLSVIIPARLEQFLLPTVQDILKNRRLDTEVIVILDGSWPLDPLPDHPDVHLVYHPVSIGQRAATNEGVRLSRAEFIMKCDGHVAFDEGFDAKLLAPYDSGELDRTVTSIPAQHRLHVYNRVCKACGHVEGQGPMDEKCVTCSAEKSYAIQMVWQPRKTPSTSWVLDSTLHFAYNKKDKCRLNRGIQDVMTSLGACVLMRRDRWHELDGLDESIGSWGQFGQELACKSWLSGGRHVVNTNTFFCHFFRNGGIGVPYPLSGSDQERARKRARNIWFGNKWPKQTLPLSWLIDKFWPIHPSTDAKWSDEAKAKVAAAGVAFASSRNDRRSVAQIVRVLDRAETNRTSPWSGSNAGREEMPVGTVGFSGVDGASAPVASEDVLGMAGEPEMDGVAAGRVIAGDMVENGNIAAPASVGERTHKPSPHKSVRENVVAFENEVAVPPGVFAGRPAPTSGLGVKNDLGEETNQSGGVEVGCGCEKMTVSHAVPPRQVPDRSGAAGSDHRAVPSILPSLGVLYYTHHKLDPLIFNACLRQLQRAVNGHRVVSVSWEPMSFGENIVYTPGPSPHTNYFSQIVLGLEALDTDYVALCEHDVLYDPSHLTFRPPTDDAYWYNENCWRVDAATGRAVTHQMRSVSGLVAHRELLVEHYRKMLARVKAKGYWYRMGHEPGVFPDRAPGVDSFPAMGWRSWRPNVDVRHKDTLTGSRWSPEKFEVPPSGWRESDGVPGWGKTLGRFDAWLAEIRQGA